MPFFLQGLLCGVAYVAPIGMQNSYVINVSVKHNPLYSYITALITIFFDIALALACFFGIGYLIDRYNIVKTFLLTFGGFIIIIVGIIIMLSKGNMKQVQLDKKNFLENIAKIFMVTWVNPQGIVDGTVFLGGFRAGLDGVTAIYFILGVCLASALWFICITTIVVLCKKLITDKVLKVINILCGSIIVFFGVKILISVLI